MLKLPNIKERHDRQFTQNRIRRVERSSLSCGEILEIHCLRFDVMLCCPQLNDGLQQRHHQESVEKSLKFMLKGNNN